MHGSFKDEKICIHLGDDRGWDGWMASLTRWTWVWVNSGSWWWTGRPGVLRFMESQRVRHDWATELNWGIWSCEDDKDGWFINSVLWNFQDNARCKAYTKTMRILTTEVIPKGNTELSDMQGATCPLGWLKRRGFNTAYNYGGRKNRD